MADRHLRYRKEAILCVCVIVGIVVFDQAVKYWARTALTDAPGGIMPFIPGFMMLRYMENTGAAFSMWSDATWVLALLSAVLSGFILWLLYRTRDSHSLLFRLSLCFIAGGAIGNVIDRVFLGHVVDMLEFEFVRFAVFNVADSFVCIGAAMFCIYVLFFSKKQEAECGGQTDG